MARYVRFVAPGSGEGRWGVWEGEEIREVAAAPWEGQGLPEGGASFPIGQVRLLAPCLPSKVVGVGFNYRRHAVELDFRLPEKPVLFLKPPTTVVGPGDRVLYPALSRQVEYEGEMAVVIGRVTRDVTPVEAPGCILGYTCANDITARDLQPKDGQWTVAKGFDTFCPLGPAIVTELEPAGLTVTTRLNGQVRQSSPVSDLIFGVPELVSYISQVMTLLPGDVILTGTPAGVGPMQPGDAVEIEVSSIGILANVIGRPE